MTRTRLLNLAGVAIGIAGIVFVTIRIVREWDDIAAAFASANVAWLVVAFVSGLVAMALIGINWLWIMRTAGAVAPWRRGMSWYFVGQLGKYVPGGIWPIVGQAELAHRDATPRSTAYASTAVSMVATFLGAAGVAAVTGLVGADDDPWIPAMIALVLGLGFLALAAPPVRALVHRLALRVTHRELRLPVPRSFATVVAAHLPVWIFFSGMNVFTTVALGKSVDASLAIELIYVTCLSWMAGFVVIGLPGGLGVREAVFISMMTAPLGSSLAVSVAVASRVVSITVDLAGAAASVPVARRSPPAPTAATEHGPAPASDPGETTSYAAP